VVPTAGTTYQITGISGTYNRGGTAYAITGLTSVLPNQFRWDGTPASPIIVGFGGTNGFQFKADNKKVGVFNTTTAGFGPATTTATGFLGTDGVIVSSLLSPVTSPSGSSAAAPGPLPLLGAAAAFRASRRLRRRLSGMVPTV
jgi:hypothetical protein